MKKFLCMGFLFIFLTSSLAVAQYKVDLLTYKVMHYTEIGQPWNPPDPVTQTDYDSGTLFTLQVPPCPTSDAFVFEVYANSSFRESMLTPELSINWNCWQIIVSNIIPDNIEVAQAIGVCSAVNSPQDGYRPVLDTPVQRRVVKCLINRNKPSWWGVTYKDTKQDVPEDEASKLLRKLMDKGFRIDYSFRGYVKGVEVVDACRVDVFVSSISRY